MKVILNIIGYILLGVGILGTVAQLGQIISGVPNRVGPLIFTIVLVLAGLWLVKLRKKQPPQPKS